MSLDITFWGVRGSTSCASESYKKYGGHTSCVSLYDGKNLIICDAGTGLYDLGTWATTANIRQASLLLSHAHFDHIIGFPFFGPLWDDTFSLTIHSGHFNDQGSTLEKFFNNHLFSYPFFPVPLTQVPAKLTMTDQEMGRYFAPCDGVRILPVPLFHPGGACGYRIEWGGHRVCYLSDTEHDDGVYNDILIDAMKNADLVIYDATYTDAEFLLKKGWGHSTWQAGLRLAEAAGAKKIAFFHHDPSHTDDVLDALGGEVKKHSSTAFFARQGMTVTLE